MNDKPLAVVGALVRCQDRYLIVETTKWRGLWGVPGGKIEYGEPFLDAVRRELREEVGLTLERVRLAQVQESIGSPEFHKDAHFVMLDFFADSSSFVLEYNEEIVRHAWVTLEEGLEYPLNAVTRTLLERARQDPEFARAQGA